MPPSASYTATSRRLTLIFDKFAREIRMVVWRGAGILVVVFWVIASLFDEGLGWYFGERHYADSHTWLFAVRGLLAGAMIYATALYLERAPGQIVVDKETGKETTIKP